MRGTAIKQKKAKANMNRDKTPDAIQTLLLQAFNHRQKTSVNAVLKQSKPKPEKAAKMERTDELAVAPSALATFGVKLNSDLAIAPETPSLAGKVVGDDLADSLAAAHRLPAQASFGSHYLLLPIYEGGTMSDLSGYKDLSKAPFLGDDTDSESSSYGAATATLFSSAPVIAPSSPVRTPSLNPNFTSSPSKIPHLSLDNMATESKPPMDTEISGNVQTLIRLVSDLPDGVTKQNGAQIIRLTMEAMGIPMEDVLSEAQSSQSELLDAVRTNLKKIEEFKAIIRKLESDIKYYQGKANELSEIIDLFIMSSPTSQQGHHLTGSEIG
jgi:hypothetical protein